MPGGCGQLHFPEPESPSGPPGTPGFPAGGKNRQSGVNSGCHPKGGVFALPAPHSRQAAAIWATTASLAL